MQTPVMLDVATKKSSDSKVIAVIAKSLSAEKTAQKHPIFGKNPVIKRSCTNRLQ